jgi:putative IMPACT (imprinted ancient) family translation regulator
MSKTYLVPLTEVRREQVVVNSRFIATLAPVFSVDEARAFIAGIKKELRMAITFLLYYLGEDHRYFDDGEPSGQRQAAAVLREWTWRCRVVIRAILAAHC